MRSRVVPMREMREKFGAEVRSFSYSFVLPDHGSEWDGANALDPEDARTVLARARAASPAAQAARTAQPPPDPRLPEPPIEGPPVPRRRASDKQPRFIEVTPRP